MSNVDIHGRESSNEFEVILRNKGQRAIKTNVVSIKDLGKLLSQHQKKKGKVKSEED